MQTVVFEELKRNTIINQLKDHGYTDTEGKTDKELLKILNYYKIDISCSANKYF